MPAKAPYNFVPQNDQVVKSNNQVTDFSLLDPKLNSGYIDYEVETKTPVYIRNTKLNTKKVEDFNPAEKLHYYDFFSPGNKYKIPGSSMRGLIRTFVEVASYSHFSFFDDKKLYYRSIQHPTYMQTMMGRDQVNGVYPKVESGFLKKEGINYKIFPSKKGDPEKSTQYYRVNFKPDGRLVCNPEISLEKFSFQKVNFIPTRKMRNPQEHRFPLFYALVTQVKKWQSDVENQDGSLTGYLIRSGDIPRKHMHWIINLPETDGLVLNEEVVRDYNKDINRNIPIDKDNQSGLLRMAGDRNIYPDGIPCFFIRNQQNDIIAFGHTAFFRLPYIQKISKHILNRSMQTENELDISETLFGFASERSNQDSNKVLAGKVSFEDCNLSNTERNIPSYEVKEAEIHKALSQPKQTSYQLYLEQTNPSSLLDWNGSSSIRGTKFYWHKDINNTPDEWKANPQNVIDHPKLYANNNIKPISKGNGFVGRIRFVNLSDVELGALLFALDLPEGCNHKIGLGKPYGLGSIQVKNIKVQIKNNKRRYTTLLNDAKQNWETGLDSVNDNKKFVNDFSKYVLEKLNLWDKNYQDSDASQKLWELPRMMEFKYLLNWNNANKPDWIIKTSYMNLEDFRRKEVLPKPRQIG